MTGKWLVLLALTALLISPLAFGQETSAGLQGTVKDPTGAMVVKAQVEVASPALIGTKKAETDQGGYYRFANLPPGAYTVTVTAPGFRTFKQERIPLEVGHLPTIEIRLEMGAVSETVEVSSQAAVIDATQSKVQTNIASSSLENLPTQTRSFQSVIQFAPGARSEPLQSSGGANSSLNGFQIDGASNSENSYLVEGQETASLQDGHSAANVPMDFIQEVQVKSSGFEAEYGGALGGVVNVVQKRGSNEWHGSLFTYYRGSAFDAAPNPTLIKNPQIAANTGGTRLDQPAENYQPKKDHYRNPQPGFSLGGYVVKDRLWVFGSTAPDFNATQRTIDFAAASPTPGKRTFSQNQNTYYSMARADFMATQKIRLFGSWSYSYLRSTGATILTTVSPLPKADDAFGQFNSISTNSADLYNGGIGSTQPNVIYNTGADVTLTPSLVATTRFGYFYQDLQDRGLPVGTRYMYRDTNYPYSTTNAPALEGTKALNGTTLPSKFVNSTGWSNIGANSATVFDKWKRYSFNQDLAYFKKGLGTHNLKFGYSFSHGTNDVVNGYNTADVWVAYNLPYAPQTTSGIARCKSIIDANKQNYGQLGGSADGTACQGLWGTVNLRDLGTTGKVGGWNHAFYAQDAWTVGRRLTLNLGLRLDKENLPSYNPTSGFQGVSFGWGQKMAPRLGGAFDVKGDGKIKLYASFGYFYDIMKYNLPRGSFGGDYWHDCVYALDTPDFTGIIPARDANSHYCPTGGGSVGAVGTLPAGLRFIENFDYREPANDPNQAGSLGKTGLVDPNLKPMKQHEMVFGTQWALAPSVALEARYSRKRLDTTIEDAGTLTQDGEVYYITNPGLGVNKVVPNCNGCPANPKAIRNYDGIEFRLTKRMTKNVFSSLSYTYSRLYGNYSGLTATDVSDGGAGRNGANADRAFDEPFMSFDAHGKAVDGLLPTDRPNTFKGQVYYNLKWWKFNTVIGLYQQVYSGSPLNSYISVWGAPVFVEGRGKFVDVTRNPTTGAWVAGNVSERRTPLFSQSDVSLSQDFHINKSETAKAKIGVEFFNLLNQHSPTVFDQNLIRTSGLNPATCGTAGTNCTATQEAVAGFDYAAIMTKGYDYIAAANSQGRTLNSLYGQATSWQNRRSIRFQVVVTF